MSSHMYRGVKAATDSMKFACALVDAMISGTFHRLQMTVLLLLYAVKFLNQTALHDEEKRVTVAGKIQHELSC